MKVSIHVQILRGIIKLNDTIKELLTYTDLVLLDIKHINDDKCKELVGVSNTLSLDFARYLSASNVPMWIRHVLVPGITDDEEDLYSLKDFVSSLNSVEKIEILPYHTIGKFKWDKLGKTYPLEGVRACSNNDVSRVKKILDI